MSAVLNSKNYVSKFIHIKLFMGFQYLATLRQDKQQHQRCYGMSHI